MLIFLTDNWREGFALQRSLDEHGIAFEINQTEAPRIHAEKCEEVAAFTAKWGANELKAPVLRAEKGLFIDALKGLPGTYSGLFEKKLGAKAIARLLESTENRKAKLVYVLAYCEPGKESLIFSGGTTGSVTTTPHVNKEFSLIEQLFVPEYRMLNQVQTKTLAELATDDPALVQHAWGVAEQQFAEWYKKQGK